MSTWGRTFEKYMDPQTDAEQLIQDLLGNPDRELTRDEKALLGAIALDGKAAQEKAARIPELETAIAKLEKQIVSLNRARRAQVIALKYREKTGYIDIDRYDIEPWIEVVSEVLELAEGVE